MADSRPWSSYLRVGPLARPAIQTGRRLRRPLRLGPVIVRL